MIEMRNDKPGPFIQKHHVCLRKTVSPGDVRKRGDRVAPRGNAWKLAVGVRAIARQCRTEQS